MHSPTLSRRSFLAATGGLLAAAACGSSGSGSSSGPTGTTFDGRALNVGRLSIEPYLSDTPQRLAFAISRNSGAFASGPPATIALQAPDDVPGPPTPAVLHTEGLPPGRGVYVVQAPLRTAGNWEARVAVDGASLLMAFGVVPQPTTPIPGAVAPRATSPTSANTLGVDPICTRQPPCPLHTLSLDTVIGSGTPVAVMFATPARCQSQYCGPVLDQLLAVMAPFAGRVEMVHVEIYRDATSDQLVPTVDAWGLPGEPFLFGVDGTGTVVDRLDGAFGTDEVRALLTRVGA